MATSTTSQRGCTQIVRLCLIQLVVNSNLWLKWGGDTIITCTGHLSELLNIGGLIETMLCICDVLRNRMFNFQIITLGNNDKTETFMFHFK